ncbi:Tat pathway signal sequence domain protein [Brevundimonas balnearis]|uniref:Tat pathway signal sequence domain protein n=1 Tax=Brevundimonas balnearis TaxID=1572858 RepID=A0ABV6R5G7_9CAUL
MRRLALAISAISVLATALPGVAEAQSRERPDGRDRNERPGAEGQDQERARPRPLAPLRRQANVGPCPFVKILYDAARYVELENNQASASAVGYTGEIEGVSAGCSYQGDEPITVDFNVLFNLGRGPQAQGDQRTYRYWVAVTERNRAILSKEYFDLPVNFDGQQTAQIEQQQRVVIPRAEATTSGGNFEILIGFDVTPEMAAFNRTGSRFRPQAGVGGAQ